MRRRTTLNLMVIVALLLSTVPLPALAATAPASSSPAQAPNPLKPFISQAVSPANTDGLPPAPTVKSVQESKDGFERHFSNSLPKAAGPAAMAGDGALQNQVGAVNMPSPIVNFEALDNISGYYPPDTDGEVGPNHYVQMVNVSMAVYDKSGNILYGPFFPSALWPTGDVCAGADDGDPIVIYDQLSDRWLISQFKLPNYPAGPYYECIGISKTGTPTNVPGDWWLYTFTASTTKMNDYPKISVWPDAYYMTANQFTNGSSWGGAGVWAFDRAKMLNGQPATFQYFDLGPVDINFGGMLPADLDGSTLPPAGSPAYFFEVDDSSWIGPSDAIRMWKFHVDWATPGNSTFGLAGLPNSVLPTANFDLLPCVVSSSRTCIPQQSSAQKLDSLGDRLMFRAAYRNFGDHEAVVLNHTVRADGADRAGVRWYEVRNPSTAPAIYQQGTYAPADGHYRWMGSLAMDHVGNVALGYSVSSSTLDPSIRYAGRLTTDPLGTLPQAEVSIITGSGAQTGTGARWGDYSAMSVDPVDDCTFWYTQEYIQTTGTAPWQTRVASFKFPNCALGPQGTLTGVVTNTATSAPIVGAAIQATATVTQSGSTSTVAGGAYSMLLLTGSYSVTASAFGFLPKTVSNASISEDVTTTLNIGLDPAPSYVISGTVRDAQAGWPLYAKIDITGYPGGSIWTDPVTGFYSVTLPSPSTYQFNVSAYSAGYTPTSVNVGPVTGNATVNIGLNVDAVACVAPGYSLSVTGLLEQFSSNALPAGWAVTSSGTCPWTFNDPGARGNLTGGTGGFAVADSDICGSGTTMSTTLTSPAMNVSALANVNLAFNYDYNNLSTSEVAATDVSADNGATWTNLVTWNTDQRGPALYSQDVTALLSGATQARIRFRYEAPGWDWWWEVDNAFVGEKKCLPNAGGLVVGDVTDANTTLGLAGVDIDGPIGSTTTNAGGYYTLFAPAGSQYITASLPNYKTEVATAVVPLSGTVRQDFALGAGQLTANPTAITVSLTAGVSTTVPLTLTNSGNLTATFNLLELDGGGVPYGPFEKPTYVVKQFRQDGWKSAIGLGIQPYRARLQPYAAGEVIQSWTPAGVAGPWGIAYDGNANSVWVSSPAPAWTGVNRIYEFTPAGVATGRSYPYSWNPANGPADAAYNWKTGMLWVMNINTGVANCIYEIDPANGPTGNKICPTGATGFATSQRAVAYDPTTDTYYAGGWNDQMVYQFKPDGTLLNSKNVGLAVAGLAYNPTTKHLFAVDSATASKFYVLDTTNNYALLGSFSATGLTGGQGLEIDCSGNLWATDAGTGKVLQIKSGEAADFCSSDVTWLSTVPVSGTIASAATQPVAVTLNGAAVQPGVYNAQLKVKNDTPYTVNNIPVKMTVTAPATWGKLTGNVSTLGYCDATPATLAGVTVTVQSAATSWDLVTDATGQYNYWLDQSYNPLTLTVNLADYALGQVTNVNLVGGNTTTNDFVLRWLKPCVTASPMGITTTLSLGQSTTRLLKLSNDGGASTAFSLTEQLLSAPTAMPMADLVVDGSFEATNPTTFQNPNWTQGSTAFGTVLCDATGCGTGGGTAGARTGSFWAWFGGSSTGDTGYLQQTVTTGGPSTLKFYLWIGAAGTSTDYIKVSVDGTELFRATAAQMGSYSSYTLVTVPVNAGAGSHVLRFDSVSTGLTNFSLDDVSLTGGAGASADVLWLTETPVTGTLASDISLNTTIGFDANAVALPGTYKALVNVNSFDPINPVRTTTMIMNVTASASWGVLTGTVNSLGYCDVNSAPAADATVMLEAANGLTRTVTTGADGTYTLWLNSLTNPYTLTVTAADHDASTPIGGITVDQLGAVTVAPTVDLRSIEPCVDYAPAGLSVTVPWQGSASQTLTLTNSGAASSLYTVTEQTGGFIPMAPNANPILVVNPFETSATRAFTTALTNLGYAYVVTTATGFEGMSVATLLTYDAVIHAGSPGTGASATKAMAYMDGGGRFLVADNDMAYAWRNTAAGPTNMLTNYFQAQYVSDAGSDSTITGLDIMAGVNTDISGDPFPDDVTILGPDSVGIFQSNLAGGQIAGGRIARNTYKAVYLLWDFYYAGGSTVGDAIETTIVQKAMDWLLTAAPTDVVPWLAETPDTGTLAANTGTQAVTVDFDASVAAITQPGTYYARLNVKTEDASLDSFLVPVTMTVVPTDTLGKLIGTVSSLGYCDVNPAPINGANLIVQDSLGVTHTLTTNASGYYQEWLAAGAYTVTASATGHLPAVGSDLVTGTMTTTLNLNLRLNRPCVSTNPQTLSTSLAWGMSTTLPLTLSNVGAATSLYTLTEVAGGFISARPESNGPMAVDATFSEGFEDAVFPPSGWSRYALDNSTTYQWLRSTTTPHAGAGVAYHSFGSSSAAEDGLLVMPAIELGAASQLVFWERTGFPSDYVFGKHSVWVCTTACDAPMTNYTQITETGQLPNTSWRQKTIDLSGYANQTVYLAFRYEGDFADGWYLDDVSVTGIPGIDVVKWVAEEPTEGSVAADNGTQVISVTFNAGSSVVTQPGDYFATLRFANDDTVKPVINVPVTMTVSAPATWGKLTGVINGYAACDTSPVPLANASVLVQGATMSWTLTTDASGVYQVWAEAAATNPVTVTASKSGFVAKSIAGINFTAAQTVTQNINLSAVLPCAATYVPSPLTTIQSVNQLVTKTLTISNTGAGGLNWNFLELSSNQPDRLETVKVKDAPASNRRLSVQAGYAIEVVNSPSTTFAPQTLINDGSFENTVSAWAEVDDTSCTPWIGDWSSIVGVTAYHGTQYFWAGGYCGAPNSNSASQSVSIPAGSNSLSFYYYAKRTDADGATPGYAYVKINNTPVYTLPMILANNTNGWVKASINAAAYAGQTVTLTFGAENLGTGVGNVFFDYVDVSRACTPNALPWVSAVPVSGTTAAAGFTPVNVVFDSTGMAPGSYSGYLCLNTNDPTHANIEIPVATTIGADLTLVYHDLEDVVHAGETVFAAGDFNSWDATATQMTANGDNSVFTVTVPTTQTSVQLKYIVYTDTLHTGPANWNWLQSNNRTVVMTGNVTAHHYRNIEPGYYVLQFPFATSTVVGVPTENIYGQIWADDLTARSGAPRGLRAELGYGTAADAALWSWQSAVWSSQAGNNDEFAGAITPNVTGVYSYAVRYNGNWGAGNPNDTWFYGDKNWGTPFSTTEAGVLTVAERRGVMLSPATSMLLGATGSVVTHTLRITNTGSTTDTFGLTATGNTWAVSLSVNSITLGAGQGATIYAYASIPPEVETSDTVTVKAASMADATRQATATLTTAVKYYFTYLPRIGR